MPELVGQHKVRHVAISAENVLERSLHRTHAPWLAFAVLVFGLAMSALAWHTSCAGVREAEQERFARLRDRLITRVNLRLTALEDGLRGTRGVYVASGDVTRDEFRSYAESREMERRFPGLMGLGFIRRVPRDHLDEFIASTRADGLPDFSVQTQGDHRELYIIEYLEPFASNRPAIGLDLASRPELRETAEHAMRTGEIAVTRMLPLTQSPDAPGLVMLLPIYRQGKPPLTEAERVKSLIGWASAPMLLDTVLRGMSESVDDELSVAIYDGRVASAEATLHDSENQEPPARRDEAATPAHFESIELPIGGRIWMINIQARPAFYAATDWSAVYWELATGTTASVLLSLLVLTLGRSRQRALRIAAEFTDALRASEERWQLAVAANGEGIWDWNLDTDRVYYSPVWIEQLGIPEREMTGTYVDWASRVHPDDLAPAVDAIRAYADGRSSEFRRELRMRHTDGSWRWILTRGIAKRDATGRAVRMIGSHADITREKAAAQALLESERFARGTVDALTNHISILDGTGTIIATNRSWREFGESNDGRVQAWEGTNYLEVCDNATGPCSEDAVRVACGIREVISGKSDVFTHEYPCHGPDEKRWFMIRATRFAGEGPLRIVISHENVTDRRLAMESLQTYAEDLLAAKIELERQRNQLEQANHAAQAANLAKSAFLANMSHEIRTPMTAILGFADLLLEPDRDPEERDEFGRTIKRNGEHLLSIINDILDLSKIEAGKMSIERIPCDVETIIQDAAHLLFPRAEAKGLDLKVTIEGSMPRAVLSDPTRLRQVLLNLAGNAIKFTHAGRVEIIARHECETLTIEVRDTGIGIAPEHLGRLFEPFAQADESMTRRFGGSGLGLPISLRLAELLDGTITVQSTAGEGSRFRFVSSAPHTHRPPVASSSHAPSESAEPLLAPARLVGRILLAEDGADNQRLISHLLRGAGAEVEIAPDGSAAVVQIDQAIEAGRPFNLVLMDMQMPVLDGYAAARRLRASGLMLPIIALTAHAMPGDRELCISAGCDDYLAKPVRRAQLLARCAHWLEKSAGGAEHPSASPADSNHDRSPSAVSS